MAATGAVGLGQKHRTTVAGHGLSDTGIICPPTLSVGKCVAGSFGKIRWRRRLRDGSVQTYDNQF